VKRFVIAGVTLAGLAASSPSRAAEWNAGLVTGVCGTGTDREYWQHTCWFNGLRADVLFGRESSRDFALGPHVDITTAGFDDARFGGGASLLVPTHPIVPVVLSGGGYARKSEFGWEPGLAGFAFAGTRSYNYHSGYGVAAGLLVGLQYGLGDSRESAIVIALQLDGQILLLPFVAGYQLLRGPAYK
jgi:hypothetical protein